MCGVVVSLNARTCLRIGRRLVLPPAQPIISCTRDANVQSPVVPCNPMHRVCFVNYMTTVI